MGTGREKSRDEGRVSALDQSGRFTYRSDAVRIVFGAGAIEALRRETTFHRMSRLVVLCSKSRADFARRVTGAIADRCVGFCETAGQNMPRDAFDRVVGELQRLKADGFIVVGGGSPIGLAKAAAATTKIPYIAVVTTYSGSEMAARWYIGVADDRISGEGAAALPATAIYDPELTLDLPTLVSAASGMNAMAHAVESLYGIDTNPVVETMAEEAVRLLGSSLPRIVKNPRDVAARSDALYGAWLAANFRAAAGLEHALAQRVRQWFNLDHAQTHAIATPYAIGYNAGAAPAAMARIDGRSASPTPRADSTISTSGWACRPASRRSACAKPISARPSKSWPPRGSCTRDRPAKPISSISSPRPMPACRRAFRTPRA